MIKVRKYSSYFYFIPAIMLFVALFSGLPYGYFQALRWVVSLTAAHFFFNQKKQLHAFIFEKSMLEIKHVKKLLVAPAIIAIIFNPIAPFHLARETWMILDAAAGIIMLFYGYLHFINNC